MASLRLFGFVLILLSFQASAHQPIDTSRLIIAFHEKDYMALGGANEAATYINAHWGKKKLISLVRPLGNSTILVELIEESTSNLNKIVDDLSKIPKIRYVEKDYAVDTATEFETNLPTIYKTQE